MLLKSTISPDAAVTSVASENSLRSAQVLTVNVEDYFQAGVFHRFIDARHWYRFDSRLQRNVEETLNVLELHQTKATFFVLGWIAEQHPELIRRIADAGHEVASRGYLHHPLLSLGRAERREDLTKSRQIIEDTIGQPVAGFRLADGWLRKCDLPFLDEVREAGYLYDSSLMPRRRDFATEPFRRGVHLIETSHGPLLELPPSTIPAGPLWLPIAGGNYLRQFPSALMRRAVRKWTSSESLPYVMYFQVWEMDDEQPELSAVSRISRIRHYRNLGKYRRLLPEFLTEWKFTSVRDHAQRTGSPFAALQRAFTGEVASSRDSNTTTLVRRNETISSGAAASARKSYSGLLSKPDIKLNRCQVERTPVTLIIPCYNEESSLPYLARTLEHLRHSLAASYSLNVVFVDDCSRDNTSDLLRELFGKEAGVRIVHHERNKGVSAAILTGMRASETEIVCSMDCDCSYDPHEIERMLPLLKPDVAMVTASPYHRNGGVRNVPGWRLVLSHTLSRIYRLLLRRPLATWTSCFRVYRRSQILDLPLRENGFLGTAELAAQLSLQGRRIVEHPAVLDVRLFGASKMKTLRTIGSHLRLLSRVVGQKLKLVPSELTTG